MADLKSIKKGDKVILRMFTGAFVEAKEVEMADAKKIGFTNKKGVKMVFDKGTGKQVIPEPKKPQFANYLEEYSEEAEQEGLAKKARKPKKEAEEAKPKAAKKPLPKKVVKKPKAAEEAEVEDDDEDFEDEGEE